MHKVQLPSFMVRGRGILDHIPEFIEEIGLGRASPALIICDETTYQFTSPIENQSIFEVLVHIITNASIKEVENSIKSIKKNQVKFVFGLGGGRPIDVAKLATTKTNIPYISVPTALSHDGIASGRASIENIGCKVSVEAKTPLAIIADLDAIEKAPRRLFSAGCGDGIANYTAVLDWRLAHRIKSEYYGGYAAQLSMMTAETIIQEATQMRADYDYALNVLLEALVSSSMAMAIAGSSRPASGAEHLFSHALDQITPQPALHGEQSGLGTIMMAYLHDSRISWKEIKKTLITLGAPTTAEDLEIEPKYIIKALTIAHKIRDRFTILGSEGLTKKAAEELAHITEVI